MSAIKPRSLAAFLALVLLLTGVDPLGSESVILTTYYPAPSGIYAQMITTGQTFLARDGGSVGIGTASPQAMLDVRGGIRPGSGSAGSRCSPEGAIGYDSGAHALTYCGSALIWQQVGLPPGMWCGMTQADGAGELCQGYRPPSCPPGFSSERMRSMNGDVVATTYTCLSL